MQYVYLIQSDNYYKIGIANDPQSRLAHLQTGNPYQLKIIACFGFEDAMIVERALHQTFTKYNVRNEWFVLDNSQIKKFSEICSILGGTEGWFGSNAVANLDDVAEAEEAQELLSDGAKFDYAQMFADGWKIGSQDSRGMYWNWKKTENGQRRTIYGGAISSLPCSFEEMRKRYGGE